MLIKLLAIGKTADKNFELMLKDYESRIQHYCKIEVKNLELKKLNKIKDERILKTEEGLAILAELGPSSFLILLDENGKTYSSTNFADFVQKQLNAGLKEIVFCIGGAYGFSVEVYKRANAKVALSAMTYTHQMVRLFFMEQLYRAFTILNGEKYHH